MDNLKEELEGLKIEVIKKIREAVEHGDKTLLDSLTSLLSVLNFSKELTPS